MPNNDLISRAAAIDAIVSVTVFLDADYIKNLCENPSNSEDWLGGVCDAINAVEEVNAVDAIPVEWLYKKMREEGEREYILHAEYIKDLICEWKKEQEAKQCEIHD